ncbi:MAG: hypothetical protein O9256_00780 [Rhizobiaceae bacterium]|nr:hypothetical protein [Rhizobiaceae bacterium]
MKGTIFRAALGAALLMASASASAESTTVLGITLGQPISYPMCEGSREHQDELMEQHGGCWVPNGVDGSLEEIKIFFAFGTTPWWITSIVQATRVDGRVEGLEITPSDSYSYEELAEHLTEKFGRHSSIDVFADASRLTMWKLPYGGSVALGVFTRGGFYVGRKIFISSRRLDSFQGARPSGGVKIQF